MARAKSPKFEEISPVDRLGRVVLGQLFANDYLQNLMPFLSIEAITSHVLEHRMMTLKSAQIDLFLSQLRALLFAHLFVCFELTQDFCLHFATAHIDVEEEELSLFFDPRIIGLHILFPPDRFL
jgi:hypothetical protein